ncbi:DUF6340 family protein [Flavobacterium sp.]|uniref:DUF6340 family protein n=1 Tax=Flavobacterium sp. TaxID=239 RepID=UPI00374DC3DF
MDALQPAPVKIYEKDITIGIINRSDPSKKNEAVDVIDKVLSIEGKNLDKEGAQNVVFGVQNELSKNNLVKAVKVIEEKNLNNTGLSIFPEALSWEKIAQICKENNVNIVYELSYYDTDAKVDYKTNTIETTNLLGLKIPMIEHQATINTLIKTGWRIYSLQDKTIIDEFTTGDNVTLSGRGINPVSAIEAIMGRKEAVLNISDKIGQSYAQRILSYNIRVSRDYFIKGTDNFVTAMRRAQTGNWDGAAELWAKEVNNSNPEIAGRACYNMAIINEINGNLDTAVEWASKSYSDYNNKLALNYLNVLKRRINKNRQL